MKITNSCKCSPMLKSHSFFQSFLRQIIIINQQHYILYQTTQIRNDKQRESTIKYQIHRGFILTAWSNNPIDQADEPPKKKGFGRLKENWKGWLPHDGAQALSGDSMPSLGMMHCYAFVCSAVSMASSSHLSPSVQP